MPPTPRIQVVSKTQFVFLLLVISTLFCSAQNKSELQKQRDELNKKIELTRKLIDESEQQQKVTTGQMQVLSQQIAFREELLHNIDREISGIDGEIGNTNKAIKDLEDQLQAMKEEYGKMVYQAYKNRSSYDRLMFVFAASDFNQAYKRFKIMQRYAEVRKQQVASIEKTQEEISAHLDTLKKSKSEKEKYAQQQQKEKGQIAKDKKAQAIKLTALQSEAKKLRDQQKKQEADRKKLTAKIEDIIRKEIEAAAKAAKAKSAASPGSTTSSTAFELAPEVKIMNTDFEKNKGGLPWPVGSGVVTSGFGKHEHPSIPGVMVNNNGMDFTTEKNSAVRSIFNGTVTSLFAIPGAGQNIIITHGSYKTVYSGLNRVDVKVGDTVSAGETIGTVLYNGEDNTLHFELWKVNAEGGTPQNPQLWLKKR